MFGNIAQIRLILSLILPHALLEGYYLSHYSKCYLYKVHVQASELLARSLAASSTLNCYACTSFFACWVLKLWYVCLPWCRDRKQEGMQVTTDVRKALGDKARIEKEKALAKEELEKKLLLEVLDFPVADNAVVSCGNAC